MNLAFEITPDDVQTALNQFVRVTDEQASKLFDDLDCDAVEKAALYGNEMDEQTGYAYEEIREQLLGLKPGKKMTKAVASQRIQKLLEEHVDEDDVCTCGHRRMYHRGKKGTAGCWRVCQCKKFQKEKS